MSRVQGAWWRQQARLVWVRTLALAAERGTVVVPAALAVLLALLPTAPGRAQTGGCTQPTPDGCPLVLGQPVQAVLADPADTHTWRITLSEPGGFSAVLSNLPVDYDLHLFRADGTRIADSERFEGDVEVVGGRGFEAGEYLLYVNSPLGQVSPELDLTRFGGSSALFVITRRGEIGV